MWVFRRRISSGSRSKYTKWQQSFAVSDNGILEGSTTGDSITFDSHIDCNRGSKKTFLSFADRWSHQKAYTLLGLSHRLLCTQCLEPWMAPSSFWSISHVTFFPFFMPRMPISSCRSRRPSKGRRRRSRSRNLCCYSLNIQSLSLIILNMVLSLNQPESEHYAIRGSSCGVAP